MALISHWYPFVAGTISSTRKGYSLGRTKGLNTSRTASRLTQPVLKHSRRLSAHFSTQWEGRFTSESRKLPTKNTGIS